MNSNSKENLVFDLVYFDGPHKTQDVMYNLKQFEPIMQL